VIRIRFKSKSGASVISRSLTTPIITEMIVGPIRHWGTIAMPTEGGNYGPTSHRDVGLTIIGIFNGRNFTFDDHV